VTFFSGTKLFFAIVLVLLVLLLLLLLLMMMLLLFTSTTGTGTFSSTMMTRDVHETMKIFCAHVGIDMHNME
jgi:hypothetical protein